MEKLKIIQDKPEEVKISREIYDHSNPEDLKFKAKPGITEELVRQISSDKGEPEWMLEKRLLGLRIFKEKPLPNFGPSLEELNLDEIIYYLRPNAKKNATSWDDVPDDIKETYEKLGIPEAERNSLGGVGAQYESEVVYHKLREDLEKKGVIFMIIDFS